MKNELEVESEKLQLSIQCRLCEKVRGYQCNALVEYRLTNAALADNVRAFQAEVN